MKHYTNIAIILGCLIALFGFERQAYTDTCSDDAGALIARAYAIAVSYPDRLPQFAEENATFFGVNGTSIRCDRGLVAQVRSEALSGPSPDSIRDRADEAARRAGLSGPLARVGVMQGLQVASFLEELIETLPDAARGNSRPYRNTHLYSVMNFVWSMRQILLPAEDVEAIRDITMEMNEWYVASLVAAVR